MKKLVGVTAAGLCSAAMVMGAITLGQTAAHAGGNCHAYGATTAPATRAIAAACNEVNADTAYSWGGGHQPAPGPSRGILYDHGHQHFDDRNRVGLDCSGLVRWAWFRATGTDVGAGGSWDMPTELTSHGFVRTGDTSPTRPGDVVVYRGHAAIYLGASLVVQAANHDAGLNVASLATEPPSVTGVFRYVAAAGARPKATPAPKHTEPPKRVPKPSPTVKATQQPTSTAPPKPKPRPKHTEPPKHTATAKPTKAKPTRSKPVKAKPAKAKPTKAPHPKSAAESAKYHNVLANAPTYLMPVPWHAVGVVHHGKSRFSCQVISVRHSFHGRRSNWWLKTDDDSGNRNVWLSATYVTGGRAGDRVPGVPVC